VSIRTIRIADRADHAEPAELAERKEPMTLVTRMFSMPKKDQPRVTDNDQGVITVTLAGEELRGWSYASDDQRRAKMLLAREYVEGWYDGMKRRDARRPAGERDR
jgi:hypothetical protein